MCQFAFYILAFTSATISLFMMSVGIKPYPAVTILGLVVTFTGISVSLSYLWLGQRMLGRHGERRLIPSLLLAVVFPSGLILANTRATLEAFFSNRMDFVRTMRPGEIQKVAWRGVPELLTGVFVATLAFAESGRAALFFFFAVSGLVSIGTMGAIAPRAVRQRITPGE
jgi:hypothetical protein